MANDTPAWLMNYCNSSFWDPNLIYIATPEFSQCFQKVLLVWGPCFFLWLFAIPKLLVLFHTRGKALPSSSLHVAKLLTTICIFIAEIIEVGFVAANKTDEDFLPSDIATPAIFAATMVLVLLLQILYRIKGQVTSGLLWLFWLGLIVCQCITLISLDQKAAEGHIEDMLSFVVFHVFYFFALIGFILSSFAEPTPNEKKEDCPEYSASFLSQILFWWFNPIVWMGYKKALVHDDLWKLNKKDMTKVTAPKLVRHWEYELQKTRKSRKGRDATNEAVVYANIGLENVVIEQNGKSYDFKEKHYKPSLVKAMAKTYGRTMFIAALYKLGQDSIQFVSPILLSKMIEFTEDPSISLWVGYVYAAGMYVVAVIQAIFLNQYFHRCMVVGMNIRTGIISMVYKKALQVSNEARKESTVGEIVNLMSTDAQRFMDLMSYIQILWSGPYVIAVCLFLLWQQLGPSIMAGFALMILLIPINGAISAILRKMSIKNMALKDKRIKLMNEILNGVKVLKLYAWEESFEDQVTKVRNKELKLAKKIAYLRTLLTFLWTVAPFLVAFITFTVFVYSDESNILTSSKAFVSTTLFNILRFPLVMLPAMISSVVQAQVSVKRLTKFLTNKEIDTQAIDRSSTDGDEAVEIKGGTFAWESDGENALKDINISVEKGALVAVVGAVGSGKSSLISAMLGEMEKKDGYVGVHGTVAYVPQTAWIQNDTLKENILFGKTMDDDSQQNGKIANGSLEFEKDSVHHDHNVVTNDRYRSIIKATALGPDLDILPGGDKTEIGEKGINLSGGQKQRVSLARAICSNADIYLLDDPLSAVDAHIGKHIFENVIGKTGLLQDKTRILVTHGIQYLTQVDWIFVMEQGVITEAGTYQELVENGEKFSKFLEEYANSQDLDESDAEENDVLSDDDTSTIADPADMNASDVISLPGDKVQTPNTNGIIRRNSSRKSTRSRGKVRNKSVTSNGGRVRHRSTTSKSTSFRNIKEEERKEGEKQKEGTKLTTIESAEEGTVKLGVYLQYVKSLGVWFSLLILLSCALYQASYVGASAWLSAWTGENDQLAPNETSDNIGLRVGVYGALGVLQGLFTYSNGMIQAAATIGAARALHFSMLKNILRVPAQFFDTTPLGRIVNRFAKDTYTVDEMLPQTIRMWLSCFFGVLGTLVVIISATPIFAAVIIPIGILYYFGQRYYVATSRQLKRIESVTRSPIYSHFGETVSGVSVIRAFGQNERFIAQSEARVDKNQECYYPNIVSNRWLSVRLEIVGNAIVFFAALFAVLSRDTIGGAVAGLSLSYALSVTSTLNWWVRQMSELETNVVAVERVREYAQVETEADWEIPEKKPDSKWPETGVVKFQNYSTRYRKNLDLVLKDIDCILESGEKVGIVGRTGAGKSSLTLALFRLIEAAGGKIVIDDVDISAIGLHDLRKKLTIIPQDPVLFSGTMRLNIDPFQYYNDDEIWNSLEHSHLKAYVSGLPDKLEHICAEGGENLSVGQRQLVCLARALLRKSKILVLDEATAAVDMQTDDLIQQTIRNEFKNCTVITIAHRLNTIMDYDKIMVLDAGKIAEFASPEDLLKQKGVFYGMAKDAGLV